jgi:[CysO sulfur-carrier protein]-thiocarboxylate-dependent cysteine synthase
VHVLSLVGRTPLVELENCSPKPGIRVFAKLEGQNPTGSIKDRIVTRMVERARAEGSLRPGQPIVEASTGNTGIALAMVGRRLGHPVRLVVPDTVFPGVVPVLQAYGAEVSLVPGDLGIKSAVDVAREIAEREGAFALDQFGSIENPRTHYETTGPEILAACPEVDVLVCGLGTGGTIMGTGRFLKERRPAVQLVAAEPAPTNQLPGLRSLADGFVPPILDLSLLDGKILVRSGSAFRAVHEILLREGLLVGPSSGAVLHAALRWAQRIERATMVLVFADSGWKYLAMRPQQIAPDVSEDEELDDVLWW